MGVVKGQGHIVGPEANWFAAFSFQINQSNNSLDTAISKIDLEKIQGQGHGWGQSSRLHNSFSIQLMRFLWFQVNWTNHSWDMANREFDLENTFDLFLNSPKEMFSTDFFQNLIRW